MPEVKEFQMDYRREVDRLLKATCEQFIKESAQKVVGPIATSLSKLKSISTGDISDKVSESMRNLKKICDVDMCDMAFCCSLRDFDMQYILRRCRQ